MSYMAVAELKKSRELGERLVQDRELVITRDGKPIAIMVGIEPEELETSLEEIRRALFSASVQRVRRRTRSLKNPDALVAEVIAESRRNRQDAT